MVCKRCQEIAFAGEAEFEPHELCPHESSHATASQPSPRPSVGPAIWELVIADMHERDSIGKRCYGVRLQPHNGRDALVDAYQEALDLCAYLRQVLWERDEW